MICPKCGSEVRASRLTCIKCGASLEGPAQDDRKNKADPSPIVTDQGRSDPPTTTAHDQENGYSSSGSSSQVRLVQCPVCKCHSPIGARFCTQCGAILLTRSECPSCHAPINPIYRHCPECGMTLHQDRQVRPSSHRPMAALLLGLIPGLLAVWGIGHIFSGAFTRGLLFFAIGLVLSFITPLTPLYTVSGFGEQMALIIIATVVWIALWLFQSVDAYKVAGGE